MKEDMYLRSRLILGDGNMEKIKNSDIWLFGAGGVGGYVAEALVRAGVGSLTVVDGDYINETNINRQIIATHSTIGKSKVSVLKQRALEINPEINFRAIHKFYLPQNSNDFDFSCADYVIDAIDTVTAKLDIIERAKKSGVKVISAMGTGNKYDNTSFEVCDIYKTHTDPLARVMRRELKKRGIDSLNVVYSPAEPIIQDRLYEGGRPVTASLSYVPPVCGFLIAGKVISDIIDIEG